MAQLTDPQLEALFDAMKGGTPLFSSIKTMNIDEELANVRKQLVEKYTQEEFRRVMREHVRPAMNQPDKRLENVIRRVLDNNPDRVAELKSKVQSIIDEY